MKRRLRALTQSVRTGLWAIPTACTVLAVLAALGLVQLDRRLGDGVRLAFGAGPDGAREVLGAIATSMITFTGLVFSITIVVLTLTSSQFSPRVLRTFLRDRQTQLSLGVFVATYVYAVVVLRTVNSTDDASFVPAVATTCGVLLLLASVGAFIAYIHHISSAIQVSSILASIGAETRATLARRQGREPGAGVALATRPTGPATSVLVSPGLGVVTHLDEDRLVELAHAAGVVLRTELHPGDFVPRGAPVFDVLGDAQQLDAEAVVDCLTLAGERTMQQDVAFGLRQLVDIAERALSPGVNDPTTAVQALDQIHDVLRQLASMDLHRGLHCDHDGGLRLVTPQEHFADYVTLALEEIEHYGKDSLQVTRRVAQLRADVASVALPEHRAALDPPLPSS